MCRRIGKPPSVILPSKDLVDERANFMIDTGSDINLIKRNSLPKDIVIDTKIMLELSGITKGRTRTLGVTNMRISGTNAMFHVVPNDFPIQQDGILGTEFLKTQKATIDYPRASLVINGTPYYFHNDEIITLPARTRKQVFVRVANPEIKYGYVPKLNAGPQVYLGNAVVSNHHGVAYLYAINSSGEDIELAIPTVKIYPFDELSQRKESIKIHSDSGKREDRIGKILRLLRLEHLNEEEKLNVTRLVTNHAERFQLPEERLGSTNTLKHRILTTDDRPINVKQYRYPQIHKEEIQRQVDEMLEKGIIEPSKSPYNSPLWIVPKKNDSLGNKKWRLVIDFRSLNEKTIGDAYPLPNIVDILDQLGSAKYFSIFDLASGFHQILMSKTDKHKTAFSTPYGHFEYNRMPFGLRNAPATFQRLMDQVLTGLQGIELFVYLDDIVIYARSLEEHAIKFQRLMKRLEEANLSLQPDKCEFLKKEVAYLGHIITENGVRPDPGKIEAVRNYPIPTTRKNIKQFLGLAGYYRRFIENFSKIAKPLSDLTKQSSTFEWKQRQQEAFDKLREALCSTPILQYPNFNEPFVITTDASGYAIGAILSQGKIGQDLPIAYASRVLNGAETRYSPTERELLALVYAVKHFRPYVYGRRFTLVMDHKPLEWLNSVADPTSRLMRWRLKLAEYEYQIKYKPGKQNKNADALSRNPVTEPKQICALQAKRSRSASSDESVRHEDKKQKISHPSDKRIHESNESGNPAPHKKQKPDELSPYEDSEEEGEQLSPGGKFLAALGSDSNDTTESYYYYETDYETDESEQQGKGEKRKHSSSSSSSHKRRIRRKIKKLKKSHEKLNPNLQEATLLENKTKEQTSSDDSAIFEAVAKPPTVPDKDTPRKRQGEDYITGVPEKRIDKKQITEKEKMPEQLKVVPIEPISMEVDSSDSFQVQTDIQVKADVHAPPKPPRAMHKVVNKTKINLPHIPENLDDITVIERNIPLDQHEIEAMEVDSSNDTDSQGNNLLKYREYKTPSSNVITESETERMFSPPSYPARFRPLETENKNVIMKPKTPSKKINSEMSRGKKGKGIPRKMSVKSFNQNKKPLPPKTPKPRIRGNQEVPVNIVDSRDHIWMKNDHIIYFMDKRGNPVDEIGEELLKRKICRPLEDFEGTLGEILVRKRTNNKYLFGIIIKNSKEQKIQEEHIVKGFENLKREMTHLNILNVTISQNKSDIGIPWYKIRNTMRLIFLNTLIKITICKGQICIPEFDDRLQIIRECHESSVGGHKGIAKTMARIRHKYFWDNMKIQVRDFIQTCNSCQKKKLVRVKTKQPMVITDTPADAFDKVSMDILGPLPVTSNDHEYILTIQDQLTKYSIAIPLIRADSEEIAKAFTRRFICQFGSPKAILTDQGSNFISSMIKKFATHFKIKQYRTTAFHPQSNGSLERSHHVLTEYLKHYISNERDWDNWLEHAMFSYNTSVHEGTKFTPYELVFGKTARLPSELKENDLLETYEDYVSELIDKLTDLRKLAVQNLGNSKQRYKHYYDRKLKPQTYKVGDRIYLLKPNKKHKFDDEYTGPYQIIEILNNNNIRIQITRNNTRIVHVNRTKLAQLTDPG